MTLAEIKWALLRRARRPGRIGALLAGAALKVAPHNVRDLDLRLWGRRLRLPAHHHLPFTVGNNPFWSMSLVHCAAALSDVSLTVIDIGANVGDSALLLEGYLPGRCEFVCIEPNTEWIPYLSANTSGMPVEIIRCFIGEGQLLAVKPTAPGSAGSQITESGERSLPLDEICDGRRVDLIKVDTDGFDFPILRSGSRTLSSRRPALFFEWYPALWREHGEVPEAVFDWLGEVGYKDFCFFDNGGYFYCRATYNQAVTIRSLVAAADSRRGIDSLHWDVFAAPPEICDRAIRLSVIAAQKLSSEVQIWNRLQPTYWQ